MSPSASNALKQISANNFTPLFPIRLVAKDLKYMRSLADQRSLKVPLAEAAFEVFTRANDEGLADDNISGVAKMYLTAEVLGANALSSSRTAAK
jgi:3-hydroxyisobutyrate dehydrogenase